MRRLQAIQAKGVTVIDDAFLILGEYLNKTRVNPPKGVGDVFLKWLLREAGNPRRVEQVRLTTQAEGRFAEFPDPALELSFDPPDRKFAAVAHAHPDRPTVWQAVDCKWLEWWSLLAMHGVRVDFLCVADARRFYEKKFPGRVVPPAPQDGPP